MRRGSWLVEEGQGMPFPNVPRKSNIAAAAFDLRAYVRELSSEERQRQIYRNAYFLYVALNAEALKD